MTKRASSAITFKSVIEEYHARKASDWSKGHAAQFLRCCEKDLLPWIGGLPLRDINAPILLDTLRRGEARGASHACAPPRHSPGSSAAYRGLPRGQLQGREANWPKPTRLARRKWNDARNAFSPVAI